jgi:hypothetical protein
MALTTWPTTDDVGASSEVIAMSDGHHDHLNHGVGGAVVERMTEAASTWLGSLSSDQHRKALLDFSDLEQRTLWHYIPIERAGLPLLEMDPIQQRLALRFVATGLSQAGFNTASTIMGIENVLDASEEWRRSYPGRGSASRGRDPNLYYAVVFGEPGSKTWGWRFEGHHISLNFTIVDGLVVAPTPIFFGSNPAEAPLLGSETIRPLASTEDLGRELLHALDQNQRAKVILAPVAPRDIVQANNARVEDDATPRAAGNVFGDQSVDETARGRLAENVQWDPKLGTAEEFVAAVRHSPRPKGLAATAMTVSQREILRALLRQYTDRLPDPLASYHAAKFAGSALEGIHFAWAGGSERRQPHYYRLQGPRLLVEYDCTQDNANHIHSVWRDPVGDFGTDVLDQHYARSH